MRTLSRLQCTGIALVCALTFVSMPTKAQGITYKICAATGSCSAFNVNTNCQDPVLNFCWKCGDRTTVVFKCGVTTAENPCITVEEPGLCGSKEVGYCSVDNCSTMSPAAGSCGETQCQH